MVKKLQVLCRSLAGIAGIGVFIGGTIWGALGFKDIAPPPFPRQKALENFEATMYQPLHTVTNLLSTAEGRDELALKVERYQKLLAEKEEFDREHPVDQEVLERENYKMLAKTGSTALLAATFLMYAGAGNVFYRRRKS